MPKNCTLFRDYPDVVTIDQLCEMLGGIGIKTAYSLLHNGDIKYLKVGKSFRIPKCNIVDYVTERQI
jgi:excisionase family DNA binding protein